MMAVIMNVVFLGEITCREDFCQATGTGTWDWESRIENQNSPSADSIISEATNIPDCSTHNSTNIPDCSLPNF